MSDESELSGGADDAIVNDNDAPALTEIEQLAAEMGWKPKGEIPDDRWKPANEWIKAERDINRSMKRDMRALREQIDRMASTSAKQTEKALRRQADELQQRFNDAVEARDTKAAAQAMDEIRSLEREAVNVAPTANVEKGFAERNPWYGKDEDATAYAVAVSQREAAKGKSHAEQIEAVEEAMRKRFPELMGVARAAETPTAVHAPGRAAPARRAKGYADLPPEVKKAADGYAKLFKEKHGKDIDESRREYASDYWSEQAA